MYFAPGAVRIGEKASAPVKNRSHEIVTTIELQGNEEGVPPQNPVDGAIVDVSVLGVKLAYPDA